MTPMPLTEAQLRERVQELEAALRDLTQRLHSTQGRDGLTLADCLEIQALKGGDDDDQ